MTRVYVWGDSHCGKFGADPRFILGDAEQATAHNLCNRRSKTQSWFALEAHLNIYDPADIWMFIIGEIDCRIHFHRQHVLTGKPVSRLVATTVKRYGYVIKAVRDDGRPNVAVLDAPPAVAQGNFFGYDHYGTRDERAAIAVEWNRQLGEWCEANRICFVRLYPHIADERGWLADEYAVPDGSHVTADVIPFVIDELRKCFPDISLT